MKHTIKFFLVTVILICSGGLFVVSAQAEYSLGDVNTDGAITIIDALMIAQYCVNLDPPGFLPAVADVNSDTAINIVDALIVAQYSVGLVDSLPVGSSPPQRADNPFKEATFAIPSDWKTRLNWDGYTEVTQYSTAFWMDTINSITSNGGLRNFLDEALDQGANLAMLVLFNMPNRDCHTQTSPSELLVNENGYMRYTTEFIDPIAAICADPAYKKLRIVAILEPRSLANLITCMSSEYCAPVTGEGGYVDCIQYAINRFYSIPNVYSYLTIANAGWMGWDSNLGAMADIIARVVKGAGGGVNSICGIASNVAGYIPLNEPFLPDPELQINGSCVKTSDYFEWNSFFGEQTYALTMRRLLVDRGLPASIGIIIDTSRNGWGGPGRPLQVSTSTDLNTYVDESRIDRRLHRGNWCNQIAGIGERPRANPAPYIDAYAWIKQPGFSDGVSHSLAGLDSIHNPNHAFNAMCDPTAMSIYNSAYATGAIDEAPIFGRYNPILMRFLVENAYPQF